MMDGLLDEMACGMKQIQKRGYYMVKIVAWFGYKAIININMYILDKYTSSKLY